MTASTARKPASRPQPQPKAQLKPVPAPQPKPQPEPKPAATIDTGARQVTVWFPKATVVVDGKTVELQCSHVRYGHESLKAAQSCIRSLVAKSGYRVA